MKEEQSAIHKELVTQRTNCLATLQSQGETQIAQKETSQREALQRRLANRTAALEYSDIGSPILNEDLG